MKHLFLHFAIILLLLSTMNSCFIDIPKVITIETEPFNNFDDEGNTQLELGSELIVLIPDIQLYTHYKEHHIILKSIIDRIIEMNQLGYKVKAVVQVGDVTERNELNEWEAAKTIFSKLDTNNISYILTTGNHDYGDAGTTNSRQTYFNDYFDFSNQPTFRECYLSKYYENSLFEIRLQGEPFQIISLEFGPRKSVMEWANKVLDKNKMSLLVTHAYLFKDKERYDWKMLSKSQRISPYNYAYLYKEFGEGSINVNDGENIWQKLIYPAENIRFVMCGHQTNPNYVGNLLSDNIKEKSVLQMLFNTQSLNNGGDGWMQILEFKNDKKTVSVRTYTSLYNKWRTGDLFQYDFIYN